MITNRKLTAMALLVVMLCSATVLAGQTTPGIDRRERRQSRRIKHGVNSGSITRREAGRLRAQQARIRAHERHAKSDGVVTARERARLQRHENRANRNIYRKKHNRRIH